MIYTLKEFKEFINSIPDEFNDKYIEIETLTGSKKYEALIGYLNFIDHWVSEDTFYRIQLCIYKKENNNDSI